MCAQYSNSSPRASAASSSATSYGPRRLKSTIRSARATLATGSTWTEPSARTTSVTVVGALPSRSCAATATRRASSRESSITDARSRGR